MGLRPEDNYPANSRARGPIPDIGAHMSFLQRLTRAYLVAFLALLMLAALLGGASALTTAIAGSAVVGIKDSFFVVFLGTLLFGAAVALATNAICRGGKYRPLARPTYDDAAAPR